MRKQSHLNLSTFFFSFLCCDFHFCVVLSFRDGLSFLLRASVRSVVHSDLYNTHWITCSIAWVLMCARAPRGLFFDRRRSETVVAYFTDDRAYCFVRFLVFLARCLGRCARVLIPLCCIQSKQNGISDSQRTVIVIAMLQPLSRQQNIYLLNDLRLKRKE